ncbi:hypothetical protein ACFQE1_08125, partial [Halobium palmae]
LVAERAGGGSENTESAGGGSGDAEAELTRAEIRETAEAWRPYRSYATMYLWWRYVDETLSVDPKSLTL